MPQAIDKHTWWLKLTVTLGRAQADGSDSSLYQLLARVAPPLGGQPAEVMIAISNYNLVAGGQLTAWLEVRPGGLHGLGGSAPGHPNLNKNIHGDF